MVGAERVIYRHCCDDPFNPPCEPASEWWIAPSPRGCPCRARQAAACRIARSTKAVSLFSEHSQPGDQPGERIDHERRIAEAPAVQRDVREVRDVQLPRAGTP